MNRYRSSYGFFGNIPPVVKNIIIINIIMLILTGFTGEFMYERFALYYPASPLFKPYQFLTHMFMHGNIGHLFFNMYAFWLFGSALEHIWGGKKFFLYYLITGMGAAMFYALVLWVQMIQAEAAIDPNILMRMKSLVGEGQILMNSMPTIQRWNSIMLTPMVGASGAVFGILLAYGMLFPNSVLQLIFPPIALKAKWFVLIYGVLELILGFTATASHIAHFAHVGGMLFGYILVLYWKRKGRLYL